MFDKLEDLLIRFEEILSELQEPDVANDQNRFQHLKAVCDRLLTCLIFSICLNNRSKIILFFH